MRLYIQQLEERVRQLTGENERLVYRVEPDARRSWPAAAAGRPDAPGADRRRRRRFLRRRRGVQMGANLRSRRTPQDLGIVFRRSERSADRSRRRRRERADRPFDARRAASRRARRTERRGERAPLHRAADPDQQTGRPAGRAAADDGALRLAARRIRPRLRLYPDRRLRPRRRELSRTGSPPFRAIRRRRTREFWLGESHLQQGEYRDAANAFLAVYKTAPDSPKGPDALLKLGVSLSALGEKSAACATLAEVGRRYPQAPPRR